MKRSLWPQVCQNWGYLSGMANFEKKLPTEKTPIHKMGFFVGQRGDKTVLTLVDTERKGVGFDNFNDKPRMELILSNKEADHLSRQLRRCVRISE